MGIKFKDKITAGIPVAGDVAEREIQMDLKNGSLYSSTDGTDLVALGGGLPEKGGVAWVTATVYSIGNMVTHNNKSYWCKVANNSILFIPSQWTEIVTVDGSVMEGPMATEDVPFVTEIDCSLGNSFSKTVTTDFIQTFANLPIAGDSYEVKLTITNGGAFTITWDPTVKWTDGTAPIMQTSGVDIIKMFTIDGGVSWIASTIDRELKNSFNGVFLQTCLFGTPHSGIQANIFSFFDVLIVVVGDGSVMDYVFYNITDIYNPVKTLQVNIPSVIIENEQIVCNDAGTMVFTTSELSGEVVVYDITNPAVPTIKKTITGLSKPTGIAIKGDYIYVSSQSGVITCYENANSGNIIQVDQITHSKINTYRSLCAIVGNALYVTNATGDDGMFGIIDITIPSGMVDGGKWNGYSVDKSYRILADNINKLLYSVDYANDFLTIIDCENEFSPGRNQEDTPYDTYHQAGISISGQTVFHTKNEIISVIEPAPDTNKLVRQVHSEVNPMLDVKDASNFNAQRDLLVTFSRTKDTFAIYEKI